MNETIQMIFTVLTNAHSQKPLSGDRKELGGGGSPFPYTSMIYRTGLPWLAPSCHGFSSISHRIAQCGQEGGHQVRVM